MVTHPSLNESNQTNKQTMKIRLHNVFELVVRPDGAEEVIEFQMHFKSCIERPKPSLKIRTANSIFWISLGIFRDYSLKTFLFIKIENWNFQHLFEIEFRETSQNFNSYGSFRQLLFSFFIGCLIELKFCKVSQFFFNQMLKVSAFYLEKRKSFILKKEYFLCRCQYQNKKALFADPIFK